MIRLLVHNPAGNEKGHKIDAVKRPGFPEIHNDELQMNPE
jgi:hypothetical protein